MAGPSSPLPTSEMASFYVFLPSNIDGTIIIFAVHLIFPLFYSILYIYSHGPAQSITHSSKVPVLTAAFWSSFETPTSLCHPTRLSPSTWQISNTSSSLPCNDHLTTPLETA